MSTANRRQFLCTLLTGSAAGMVAGCAVYEHESADELDAAAVLERVRAAIDGKSREEVRQELDEAVRHYYRYTGNCAEGSFMALREVFDLPDGGISRALTAFPGLGGRNETCGAVTGSLMAAGLVFGRDDKTDSAEFFRALMPTRQICEAVESAVGSTQCGDIVEKAVGRRLDLFLEEDRAALFSSPEGARACFTSVSTGVHAAGDLLMDAALA